MKIPIEKKQADIYDKFFAEEDAKYTALYNKITEMHDFGQNVKEWMTALKEITDAHPEIINQTTNKNKIDYFQRFAKWLMALIPIIKSRNDFNKWEQENYRDKLKEMEDAYDGTNPKQAEEEANAWTDKMMPEIDSRLGKLISDVDTLYESYIPFRNEFNRFKS